MKDDNDVQRRIEYESQEVIVDLPVEPIESGIQQAGNGGAREMSLGYDSGLENESNSSTSANEQEVRIETVVEGGIAQDKNDRSREIDIVGRAGPSNSHEVFTFEMETGDTDDNEIDEEEDNKVKRRKSSKKKTNSELKVFSAKPEDSDTDNDIDQNKSLKRLNRSKKLLSSKGQDGHDKVTGEINLDYNTNNVQISSESRDGENKNVLNQYEASNVDVEDKHETADGDGEIEITSF